MDVKLFYILWLSHKRKTPLDKNKILECYRNALGHLNLNSYRIGEYCNLEINLVPHHILVSDVESLILEFEPTTIVTHHPNDLNIDHRVCLT